MALLSFPKGVKYWSKSANYDYVSWQVFVMTPSKKVIVLRRVAYFNSELSFAVLCFFVSRGVSHLYGLVQKSCEQQK
ncbi:hypothetical protein B9Z55_024936 [Caenorhabditis nigoni]|uniref:Uncharacterized protein n=1 Tax=Caenorhabditis nigoni TaxID=1611254 RepID=A0A2G5SWD2_9PELO|nr:hypothetical protein B9Z55_024936 [Caenorhabditis nigoni]